MSLIEATREYLRLCYEMTGEQPMFLGVPARVYDQLVTELEDRGRTRLNTMFTPHMKIDDTLIYIARPSLD